MKTLTLIVEDKVSLEIVERLFIAAKFPINQIDFVVANGKGRAAKLADLSRMLKKNEHTALLLDSDKPTIPDALAEDSLQLKQDGLSVYFAVPEIESWLFADISLLENLLSKQVLSDSSNEVLQRIPLPEEIPYPKQLARNILRNNYVSRSENNHYSTNSKNLNFSNLDFLLDVNISKAAARSFSLKFFLDGIGKLLGVESIELKNSISSNMDRRIFSNLIKEVLPKDAIIYKTMDGRKISTQEMLNNIEEGSALGQHYTSDLLRIARDFLKHQANK